MPSCAHNLSHPLTTAHNLTVTSQPHWRAREPFSRNHNPIWKVPNTPPVHCTVCDMHCVSAGRYSRDTFICCSSLAEKNPSSPELTPDMQTVTSPLSGRHMFFDDSPSYKRKTLPFIFSSSLKDGSPGSCLAADLGANVHIDT